MTSKTSALALATAGAVGLTLGVVLTPAAALADRLLTGADIKDSSLTTADVKDRSLLASDFKSGQVPAGPRGPGGPQGSAGPQGAPGVGAAPVSTWTLAIGDLTGSTTRTSSTRISAGQTVEMVSGRYVAGDYSRCVNGPQVTVAIADTNQILGELHREATEPEGQKYGAPGITAGSRPLVVTISCYATANGSEQATATGLEIAIDLRITDAAPPTQTFD